MSAHRELDSAERRAIRKLVMSLCANYDWEYGCLVLDSPCYMMGKYWTGSLCRYFRQSVLPLNPALELALLQRSVLELRPCGFCGTPFVANRKRTYCSAVCAKKAQRQQQRKHMRKKRGRS